MCKYVDLLTNGESREEAAIKISCHKLATVTLPPSHIFMLIDFVREEEDGGEDGSIKTCSER